jgi:hypothetical protein
VCTCPEACSGKEELGRGTWFLLHEIVKHSNATPDVFEDFMYRLADLYPCKECSNHMFDYFFTNGIEMTKQWMCTFHDAVNTRLGKPVHGCTT